MRFSSGLTVLQEKNALAERTLTYVFSRHVLISSGTSSRRV